MGATYDQIFQCFIDNTGVDTSRLPNDQEKIYDMINNGARHYNTYFDEEEWVVCDNDTETINKNLDGTQLLIYAYCLKYVYLENQLVGFEELWSPFQNEIGIKDYKSQVQGRESTLERTNKKIIELITSTEDPSIM